MSTNIEHLSDEDLMAWLAGEVADELLMRIETHLMDCDSCATRIDTLSPGSDSFIDQLRNAADEPISSQNHTITESPLPDGDDRNLLFGALAMQAGFIDDRQFVDACILWAARPDTPLSDVLAKQGSLTEEDVKDVQKMVDRKAGKQNGNKELSTEPKVKFTSRQRGHIELKQLHAKGGIGQIWRAWDNVLGRDVALKELLPEHANSKNARERFFREARITSQLAHPGTVPVHEYREIDGRAFYTMKLLRGRTLTEVTSEYHAERRTSGASGGELAPLVALLDIFVSICNTIAYAHASGVIHRDLKGDNVLVGEYGEVTLLDWGLAKHLQGHGSTNDVEIRPSTETRQFDATIQGERLGTPAFMAPEQARGQIDQLDHLTDVYGLAGILYEILAGRPPFLGATVHQVLHQVESSEPTGPSRFNPDVSKELEEICLKGLAKLKSARQQSASELGGAVKKWIVEQANNKRTSQERERFFKLSVDLLGVLAPDGRYLQVNNQWTQLLGWEKEDLLGSNYHLNVHPDDLHVIEQGIGSISDGTFAHLEVRMLCKDGGYRWIDWNLTPIPNEQRTYLVGRDVTERRKNEQLFAGLLESAPDAIVIVNDCAVIQIVNAQTEKLFGYDRGELLGQPIEKLIPERYHREHPTQFAEYIGDPETRPMGAGRTLTGLHRDGSEFQVAISLSPLETEGGVLVSSTIRRVEE